jgi:hypothetical protein
MYVSRQQKAISKRVNVELPVRGAARVSRTMLGAADVTAEMKAI